MYEIKNGHHGDLSLKQKCYPYHLLHFQATQRWMRKHKVKRNKVSE